MALSRRKLWRVGTWAGLVVVLLIIAVDVASAWVGLWLRDPRGHAFVARNGKLDIGVGFPSTDDWTCRWGTAWSEPFSWWFGMERGSITSSSSGVGPKAAIAVFRIPLWAFAACSSVPTVLLWWRDRRDKGPGHCQRCRYDLRGLAKGEAGAVTCPECGKVGAAPVQE